jgi:putative Holliday junction resolvase
VTGRLLALDIGDRRIGLAVSDPLRLFARPLATLERRGPAADLAEIERTLEREAIAFVVVGHPRLPSGDRGEQARSAEAFMAELSPRLAARGLDWVWWDESYTTVTAQARRRERGAAAHRGRGADPGLDAEAAAVILEEWLAAQAEPPAAADPLGSSNGG